MKVVFDTNIVASASFWQGKPFDCLSAWARGEISIFTLFGAGGAALRYSCGIRVTESILSVITPTSCCRECNVIGEAPSGFMTNRSLL